MKKNLLFIWLIIFSCSAALAQQQIIDKTTRLIVAKKYSSANVYLDSLLKKQPKNTDALMMKGNVILNYALDTTKPMSFFSEEDESVFTKTISEKPKLLSVKTAYQVQKIWNKCLAIDSSRTDIIKGLCTVYAMALMKDSLKNEILQLIKTEKSDSGQAFRICEYARKFKERNRFDEAMELYQFIAKQFPSVAGVRCDIASEYFYAGKINNALLWLDSCYRAKEVDETSFLNGAFTYSLLGYYDDAMTVLSIYSKRYERKMAPFYYGLLLFSDSSSRYYITLKDFCQSVDSNAYYDEYYLAQKLLTYRDTFTLPDYEQLINNKQIPDYYKGLIHQRAFTQFKDNCHPLLRYGVLQSSVKNFTQAVHYLKNGETCQMKAEQAEFWMFNYGYALYKTGEIEKALVYFKAIMRSENLFNKQAAQYFTAKILLATNKIFDGKNLLKEIIAHKTSLKYEQLAAQLLAQ